MRIALDLCHSNICFVIYLKLLKTKLASGITVFLFFLFHLTRRNWMDFDGVFKQLKSDLPTLQIGIGTHVGGSQYIYVLIPGSSVRIWVTPSSRRMNRYDIVDPDDDIFHERLFEEVEPTEVLAFVRMSLKKLAEL
jgi:hypothetical protein